MDCIFYSIVFCSFVINYWSLTFYCLEKFMLLAGFVFFRRKWALFMSLQLNVSWAIRHINGFRLFPMTGTFSELITYKGKKWPAIFFMNIYKIKQRESGWKIWIKSVVLKSYIGTFSIIWRSIIFKHTTQILKTLTLSYICIMCFSLKFIVVICALFSIPFFFLLTSGYEPTTCTHFHAWYLLYFYSLGKWCHT